MRRRQYFALWFINSVDARHVYVRHSCSLAIPRWRLNINRLIASRRRSRITKRAGFSSIGFRSLVILRMTLFRQTARDDARKRSAQRKESSCIRRRKRHFWLRQPSLVRENQKSRFLRPIRIGLIRSNSFWLCADLKTHRIIFLRCDKISVPPPSFTAAKRMGFFFN